MGNNEFHSFPKNKLVAEKWISATKTFHLNDHLNAGKLSGSFYKVCRKHFPQSDLVKNGKGQTVVKQGYVPSLFLPTDIDVGQITNLTFATASMTTFISIQIQSNIQRTQSGSSKLAKPVKRLQHQHSLTVVNFKQFHQKSDDNLDCSKYFRETLRNYWETMDLRMWKLMWKASCQKGRLTCLKRVAIKKQIDPKSRKSWFVDMLTTIYSVPVLCCPVLSVLYVINVLVLYVFVMFIKISVQRVQLINDTINFQLTKLSRNLVIV